MIIKLKKNIVDKCHKFAEECVKTNSYYASRGQSNVEKITNDIFVGKLGEWAARIMLIDKGFDISEPDMEIYGRGKKSHDADLSTPSINFSIKTQNLDSIDKYGMSWLMEKKSLSKFAGHQVILCIYLGENKVLIQNIIPFERMLAVQKEPRLAHLTTKCAFYYEDIICYEINKDLEV
jgi:hypothetical protein